MLFCMKWLLSYFYIKVLYVLQLLNMAKHFLAWIARKWHPPPPKTQLSVNQAVWETLLGQLLYATMYLFHISPCWELLCYSTAWIIVKSSQHHLFINWISSNMNFIYETKNFLQGAGSVLVILYACSQFFRHFFGRERTWPCLVKILSWIKMF